MQILTSTIHSLYCVAFLPGCLQGFFQALFLRTLSSGIYFPLFDLFQPVYAGLFDRYHAWRNPATSASSGSPHISHPLSVHFLAGNTAGAVSGVVLNQLTAIKYASWDAEHGFLTTARRMWDEGGMRPFMKGIVPTVIRDTIFGGVFALTKEGCARGIRKIQSRARKVTREEKEAAKEDANGTATHHTPTTTSHTTASLVKSVSAFTYHNTKTVDFVSSLLAGALGTIVSSPFNYVRNIKYGWPASETPPGASRILSDLLVECRDKARAGGWMQGAAHLQDRLRIGWGTARVAVGMAVGYELYELCKAQLDQTNKAALK